MPSRHHALPPTADPANKTTTQAGADAAGAAESGGLNPIIIYAGAGIGGLVVVGGVASVLYMNANRVTKVKAAGRNARGHGDQGLDRGGSGGRRRLDQFDV